MKRMESEQFEEYKSLVNEVTKGMTQVKHLKASSSSSSTNLEEEPVLERMLASYEEALSILHGSASEESDTPASSVFSVWEATQTGQLSSGQPKPMKRKLFSRVIEQVSLTTLSALADDGYAWRKYGQKSILGCQYPRSYYRCTHRHEQGCLALKQVQRSDDDPSMYAVTYRGKHTCSRIQPVVPQVPLDANLEKKMPPIKPIPTYQLNILKRLDAL